MVWRVGIPPGETGLLARLSKQEEPNLEEPLMEEPQKGRHLVKLKKYSVPSALTLGGLLVLVTLQRVLQTSFGINGCVLPACLVPGLGFCLLEAPYLTRRWEITRLERKLASSTAVPQGETVPAEAAPAAGFNELSCSKNGRLSERRACAMPVKVWSGDGNGRGSISGMCVDISRGGMGVALEHPVRPHSRVRVQDEPNLVVKYATVRYCQERGTTFFAGLRLERMTLREILLERGWLEPPCRSPASRA